MAKIGNLEADLTLNSATFNNHLTKATGNLKRSSSRMNRSLAKVERGFSKLTLRVGKAAKGMLMLSPAIAAAAGGAGMALLIKRSLDAADAIAKTADKVGLTTDQLQELRFAADLAGVGQTTLDMAMQRFSRRLGEVAQGQGELLGVAKQYGVALRDGEGRIRSNVAILKDFADVIKNAESDQERLRISFKLFDSEGAALVNMLREGSSALETTRQRARDLGLVIDEKLVRSAADAKDKLTVLGTVLDAKVTAAVVELAPEIGQLTDKLVSSLPVIIDWVNAFGQMVGLFEQTPVERLSAIVAEIEGVQAKLADIDNDWTPDALQSAEIEYFTQKLAALNAEYAQLWDTIEDGRDVAGAGDGAAPGSDTPSPGTGTPPAPNDMVVAGQGITDSMMTGIEVYNARLEELKRHLDAGTISQETFDRAVQAAQETLTRDADKAAEALKRQGQTITTAVMTPLERYNARLEELQKHLDAGTISQETFERASREAKKTMIEQEAAADELGQTLGEGVGGVIEGLADGYEDLRKSAVRALVDIIAKTVELQIANASVGSAGAGGGGGGGGGLDLGGMISSGIDFLFGGGGGSVEVAARESGGPVIAGHPYIVGEAGPELIVSGASGTVIPNHALGGGGGINITADLRGASVDAVQRLEAFVRDIDANLEQRAIGAVGSARQSGQMQGYGF